MFDDTVVNLTYYFHPGGQFLLHNAVGQDIGQYMNGSLTNTKGSKAHTHTSYAYCLLRQMTIARIDRSASIMTPTGHSIDVKIEDGVES